MNQQNYPLISSQPPPRKIKLIQVYKTQQVQEINSFQQLSDQFVSTRFGQETPQQNKPAAEEQLLIESSPSMDQSFSSTNMPSLQYVDENESPTKQVHYPCFHCNQKIMGVFYELPCLHIFHKLCLYEGVILSQMNSAPCLLRCICQEIVPLVSLRTLYSQYNADNLLNQIYINQQKELIKNIKNVFPLLKCVNCEFLFIQNGNIPEENYCPLCLMYTKSRRLN